MLMVIYRVLCCLTINIQQAVRILKWWNEYRESTGTAYGSDSAETSCARHGAELPRPASAISRQPQGRFERECASKQTSATGFSKIKPLRRAFFCRQCWPMVFVASSNHSRS